MRVVALTFHDVIKSEQPDGEADGDSFYRIAVSELERLLKELRRKGYQTASSREFRRWQRGETTLPDRTVVLTFDDGYASHFELVAPLLVRYRFSGTFFVTTDLIGRPGYLTWEQLRKMVFLGMEVGSHGMSHQPLTKHPAAALDDELCRSKQMLEQNLGVPIHAIAAPGGFWNATVAKAVQKAGYDAAWISEIGTNGHDTQALALRRVVVHRRFSVDHVTSMVEGWKPAFWWAARQQMAIRMLKRVLGVYWYEQLKRRVVPNA